MIDKYVFGSIVIKGKKYNCDVEIRWTGEVLEWWRKEGHVFDIEDVKRAVEKNPDIIILGTGDSGMAKVTEECRKFIQDKGIELIIKNTPEAVKVFNLIQKSRDQKKVIGLFHLTC
ncbi:hypothetical protein J7K24_00555 [bacterium]|nr:hypothetical protein [bacterium]